MKTRMLSAVMAAFMLATASVGGITASAAEKASAGEDTAETTAVDEDSSADTTETTADTAESSDTEETSSVSEDNTDDMEKFREVMSDLAEAGTTEVAPDYYGDDYYDTDGNATLIKSERIVYNSEEMQFIAVTTKDGHVFYVLINYSAQNAEDQVFFLNKVDDYDLPELRTMMRKRKSRPNRQLRRLKRQTAGCSPAMVQIPLIQRNLRRTAKMQQMLRSRQSLCL